MLFARPAPPRQIVAIGHSHLFCLEEAYRNVEVKTKRLKLKMSFIQLWAPEYQPWLVDGELNERVAAELNAGSFDAAVTLIGGNCYNMMALIKNKRPFDFVLPEAPDAPLEEEAEVLPYGALQRRMDVQSRAHFELMAAIRAATTLPLLHLESPPPIGSEAHILAHPHSLETAIKKHGLTSPPLRWKLWRLQSANYRRVCKKHGARFIPVPPEMQDERGFLIERAWPSDPVHANAVYGEAIYRQLERLFERTV